jgi:hypothetical protein
MGQWLVPPSHTSELTLPQPFLPNQKFSQSQKLKHSAAVPKLVVNLSLYPRQPCPRMFEQANFNKFQWAPIKRLLFLPNGHEAPKNRSSVSSKRFTLAVKGLIERSHVNSGVLALGQRGLQQV